jgi:predicted metal-dependent peptidase
MIRKLLDDIIEKWFLFEPALFRAICTHDLVVNNRISCAMRCGKKVIEYNPKYVNALNQSQIEGLLKVETIRILLKHPYERKPDFCSQETAAVCSNLVIADNYRTLNMPKPEQYNLKKHQCYEYYCMELRDKVKKSEYYSDLSELWEEDDCMVAVINDIIKSSKSWGTIRGQLSEVLKISTHSNFNWKNALYGFRASILSSQRHLTRLRPNRRTGFDNMGTVCKYITSLLIAVDVSGSISDEVIEDFYSTINRVFKYGFTSVDVIQFDCGVRTVQSLKSMLSEVTIVGRGGTSFDEPVKYAHEHYYDGLIMMTDGFAEEPQIPQNFKCKILWVCEDKYTYELSHQWMRKYGRVCYLSGT